MTTLYTLARGDAPLVINIPHVGTWVPTELRPLMTGMWTACTISRAPAA